MATMFKRILIANRGEIALRIIRACREMGIETVAVFSEADRGSAYLELADEAYCIGPAQGRRQLPEDRSRDQRGRDRQRAGDPSGLRFPGRERPFRRGLPELQHRVHRPAARGDGPGGRQERGPQDGPGSRACPPCPAATGWSATRTRPWRSPGRSAFPVLVKASAGGGGRGMRVAVDEQSLRSAIQQAQAEAEAAFGYGDVYLEKYVEHPRHVEVQVIGDTHGNVVHLWERDCTMQRRHQKLVEESPAPRLDAAVRAGDLRVGGAAGQGGQLYQRRHGGVHRRPARAITISSKSTPASRSSIPVTEMVTGIDLIKAQIRVAAGEPLPFTPGGHPPAAARRSNAASTPRTPTKNFRPSPGTIIQLIVRRAGSACASIPTSTPATR